MTEWHVLKFGLGITELHVLTFGFGLTELHVVKFGIGTLLDMEDSLSSAPRAYRI
jgi:hypothetical protein